jgi:hypothetical protein
MMDMSSVVDAGLALAGALGVLFMGLGTFSIDSTTVSTVQVSSEESPVSEENSSLPNAA